MENEEVVGRPGRCRLQGYFGTEPGGDGEASQTDRKSPRGGGQLGCAREKSWVARVVGEAQGSRLEKKILQSFETFLKSWKQSYLDTAFIYFNFYIILKVIFHLLIAKSWLYSPLYDTSFLLFSRVWLFATPWTAACQTSLSFTISWSLLKLVSIESIKPSSHLILCHPLLILPFIFPSTRVFPNKSALHIRRPKDCSFSFSINPSNEDEWLISFRMDWLDLLAAHGTLKSLLQHHSSKASILQCSAFFIHPWVSLIS